MAEIRKLQANDIDIYPVTHESAVYDNDGVDIASKYVTKNQLQSELDKIGDFDTTEIDGKINTLQTNVGNLQTNVGNLQTNVGNVQTSVTNLQNADTQINNQLSTMQNSINAIQQIHYSTSEPTSSQGKNGDIWVVYKN